MFAQTEEYCQLVATQKFLSTKITLYVDYGKNSGKMKDESGKNMAFESVVDALNFMNQAGWEFVNAYPITVAGSGQVLHFYLKRKIVK